MMNKKIFNGLAFIIYALALTVGPKFSYPGCPTDGMVMNCHKSLAVIFWVGVIIGIIGLALILIKNREILLGGHIAGIIASAVVVLIPTVIIGICQMETMPCKVVTFPIIYLITLVFFIINSVGIVLELRSKKRESQLAKP
jgi:hypothetical protein